VICGQPLPLKIVFADQESWKSIAEYEKLWQKVRRNLI